VEPVGYSGVLPALEPAATRGLPLLGA